MPHLICPTCRLTSSRKAGYATSDRCPRCDSSLVGEVQAEDVVRRWMIDDLRAHGLIRSWALPAPVHLTQEGADA
jgi:hypothetical protein